MITVGEILKKAREKKKMNISEVQSATRIVSRYIEALENNNFSELPGDIYVKGFLKNISEVLELNPKEVIELYRLQKTGIVSVLQASNPKNKIKKVAEQKELEQKQKIEKAEKEQLLETEQKPELEDSIESIVSSQEEREILNSEDNTDNNIDDDKEQLEETDNSEQDDEIDKKFVLPQKEQIKNTQRKPNTTLTSTTQTVAEKKKNEQFDLYSAESALLMLSKEDISLSNSRKNRNRVIIIILLSVLFLSLFGVLFKNNIAYLLFRGKNDKVNTNVQRNIVDTVANQNVKVGDVVYFKPLGISATVKFLSIGNVVRVNINGSDMSLSKSNPVVVDLNSNGVVDFRMTLIEVYEDLATVRMERLEENQMVNSSIDTEDDGTTDSNQTFIPASTISSSEISIINGEIYIEADVEKKDIKVDITAKHFVYVRYFIDSERPATVNLLSGRSLNLEARDVIMLTVGNAAEVVVKINGKMVSLGEYGETVNKTIKWVRNVNDSTKFSLVVSDTK